MDSEQLREGGLLGFAELGELLGDVCHGTSMLAQLHGTARSGLHVGGEAVSRQQGGQFAGAVGEVSLLESRGISLGDRRGALASELGDEFVVTLLGHEAQRIERDVVVCLFECVASCGCECTHLGRAASTATLVDAGTEWCLFVHGEVARSLQGVEMATYGGRRQLQVIGDLRCGCRTAFEQAARNPSGGTGDFHNASVT